MRKPLIIALSVLFVLFVGGFVYSNSFVAVNVSGDKSGNGKITYSLLSQKTHKVKVTTTQSSSAKFRLPKAGYVLTVTQGETSYVRVLKTSGLLKTVHVSAPLQPEKSRRFVGNNPADCIGYSGALLASYSCGDVFGNVKIHNPPADNSTPTYISAVAGSGITGYLRGMTNTSEGLLALIQHPSGEDVEQFYSINILNDKFMSAEEFAAPDLTPTDSYFLQAYNAGFIVYNSKFDQGYYYQSVRSKPQKIAMPKPNQNDLVPVKLTVNADAITILYSSDEDIADAKAHSEVIVSKSGQTRDFKIKRPYTKAMECGNDMLCALDDGTMDVYAISGGSLKKKYSLAGVTDIQNSPGGFLVINGDGVINFNASEMTGFMEYSFHAYKFHSLAATSGGYVLILDRTSAKRVALYIDQKSANTDSIDKKVAQLETQPEVSAVSIYGNYIFISPMAGELVYDPTIKSYGYDPAKLASSAAAINSEIDKLGINRQAYTIINTLQQ